MNGLLLNWIIALVVVLLFFAGLYLVVRAAVKSAVKEAAQELGREVAKKVWADDQGNEPPLV